MIKEAFGASLLMAGLVLAGGGAIGLFNGPAIALGGVLMVASLRFLPTRRTTR